MATEAAPSTSLPTVGTPDKLWWEDHVLPFITVGVLCAITVILGLINFYIWYKQKVGDSIYDAEPERLKTSRYKIQRVIDVRKQMMERNKREEEAEAGRSSTKMGKKNSAYVI